MWSWLWVAQFQPTFIHTAYMELDPTGFRYFIAGMGSTGMCLRAPVNIWFSAQVLQVVHSPSLTCYCSGINLLQTNFSCIFVHCGNSSVFCVCVYLSCCPQSTGAFGAITDWCKTKHGFWYGTCSRPVGRGGGANCTDCTASQIGMTLWIVK